MYSQALASSYDSVITTILAPKGIAYGLAWIALGSGRLSNCCRNNTIPSTSMPAIVDCSMIIFTRLACKKELCKWCAFRDQSRAPDAIADTSHWSHRIGAANNFFSSSCVDHGATMMAMNSFISLRPDDLVI